MIDGVLIDVKDEATRSPLIYEAINDSCSQAKDCIDKNNAHEKDILYLDLCIQKLLSLSFIYR